jgi:hypothetical protein
VREVYYSLQQRLKFRLNGSLSPLRYLLVMCTVKVLALHFNSLFQMKFCSNSMNPVRSTFAAYSNFGLKFRTQELQSGLFAVSLDLSVKMLSWFCPLDFPPLLPPEATRHCYSPLPTSLCLAPKYWQRTAPQI